MASALFTRVVSKGARLRLGAAIAVVGALAASAVNPPAAVHAAPLESPATSLTNLEHLTWLTDEVPVPKVARHSTYRVSEEPTAIAPWTYADRNDDGSYRRVGGGTLDPDTGDYTQGAYNADDIARAAVVYLRAWRGGVEDEASREMAYQLLRSLTYLQTTSGPDAGNVVLWQQASGALNPSAEPVELPDPSDSDESYWLARTVWALGEGYAAFDDSDPEFAEFLADRMALSIEALQRASLGRVGKWEFSDGMRVPGWLSVSEVDYTSARSPLHRAICLRHRKRFGFRNTAFAVISLDQRRPGPPSSVGRTLPLSGRSHTVIILLGSVRLKIYSPAQRHLCAYQSR